MNITERIMKWYIRLAAMVLMLEWALPACADGRSDSIRAAVDAYAARYPEARYQDYYKNFMQDYYGPGHILADTAAAGRYLRSELAGAGRMDGALWEPTGYKGNFVRVNLSLLRDGIVDYPTYFDAFVSSVQAVEGPEPEVWLREWAAIDSIIMASGLDYPGLQDDRNRIMAQLREGKYVVHHSRHFNDNYSLHYRIISRDLFRRRILPLITPQ